MQKSPRIAEISTKVVGILFYVHPVQSAVEPIVVQQSIINLCTLKQSRNNAISC